MSRKNKVPVYSVNARSAAEKPLRFVSEQDAYIMCGSGCAVVVSKRNTPLRIQLKEVERVDRNDPSSITCSDMRVLAGEMGGRAARKVVEAKIAMWPVVGDPLRRCSL